MRLPGSSVGARRRPGSQALTVQDGQVERAVEKCDVGEGLREIPEKAPAARVVLLGEEAHVVKHAEQTLEQRRVGAIVEGKRVDKVERTGQKGAPSPTGRPSIACRL
jgi:hypothetical protein